MEKEERKVSFFFLILKFPSQASGENNFEFRKTGEFIIKYQEGARVQYFCECGVSFLRALFLA